VVPRRDTAGAHLGWYWGNFIPQIPEQLMRRYTKKGDWVLDPFLGSGTTLIECRRLGRNGLGVELNDQVAAKAIELIDRQTNRHRVATTVVTGDSRHLDLARSLREAGGAFFKPPGAIQLGQVFFKHPPYHTILN